MNDDERERAMDDSQAAAERTIKVAQAALERLGGLLASPEVRDLLDRLEIPEPAAVGQALHGNRASPALREFTKRAGDYVDAALAAESPRLEIDPHRDDPSRQGAIEHHAGKRRVRRDATRV